jgi:hypothetical protein
LEELTKQLYDKIDLNLAKVQIIFSLCVKSGFDFTRLNNVIDSKLYQKLIYHWENYISADKGRVDASPGKKYNNIDNLIEYKHKLQEITKQYKIQQNQALEKVNLTLNQKSKGGDSPKRNNNSSKKELQNSEVYNKISNLKSKLTNYNENRNNNLNKTFQDDESKNPNKMNDMKKKMKESPGNMNNFLSTSNLPNLDEVSETQGNQSTANLNTYQNDTLSKLSEIKNKLNTFKKNSLNNNK